MTRGSISESGPVSAAPGSDEEADPLSGDNNYQYGEKYQDDNFPAGSLIHDLLEALGCSVNEPVWNVLRILGFLQDFQDSRESAGNDTKAAVCSGLNHPGHRVKHLQAEVLQFGEAFVP